MKSLKIDTDKIIILAGGMGRRLSMYGTYKPLIKLNDKPIIYWILQKINEVGINNISIVIRKENNLLKKELLNIIPEINFIEQVSYERDMLDAFLSIEKHISDSFFIVPCDLLFNYNPFFLFNINNKIDAVSVLVSNNLKKINNTEISICHFTKKSYMDFIEIIKNDMTINEINEVFEKYNKKNNLLPIINNYGCIDIDTPVDLIKAELFFKKNNLKQIISLNNKENEYKNIKKTFSYSSEKKIGFDIILEEKIIDKLDQYEIIPHENYYSPHYLLVDKNIDSIYGDKVVNKLKSVGYKITKLIINPGEFSKSFKIYINLVNEILDLGIDKKSIIFSVGGGVIKDLSGFIASTIYRGIGFICFPTTILSQCDAAIALKQGINGDTGKNLVGSFYAPMKVIIDPVVLLTLQKRYIYDGLAECLKQSFAYDLDYYNFFYKYSGRVDSIVFLEEVVKKSVELKIKSIQDDYDEENTALVNQYGHEIGHAVEFLSGYKLLHGESIAIGMRVSAELSSILGISKNNLVNDHINLLKKYKLPYCIPSYIKPSSIIDSLRLNKKFHKDNAHFVLLDKIGSLWHDEYYYSVACRNDFIIEAILKSYSDI